MWKLRCGGSGFPESPVLGGSGYLKLEIITVLITYVIMT